MANEQDEVQANPEATALALTSVTQEAISPGDKLQIPSYATKDLLSIGVCFLVFKPSIS